jgi:DNA-binding NarL/FixJ family response regulator
MPQGTHPLMLDELRPRQRQVVELMAQAHNCESAAHQLGIAVQTVKNIRRKLCQRYGVSSAMELVLKFYALSPLRR